MLKNVLKQILTTQHYPSTTYAIPILGVRLKKVIFLFFLHLQTKILMVVKLSTVDAV